MSLFNINNPSRSKSTKILAIGSYSILLIDIIQGLAFVPLYISFTSERLYGFWLASGGIIAILGFLDMGIATLVVQRISREYGRKNLVGVGKYFFNGILISSFFMMVLLISGYFFSFNLVKLFTQMTVDENQIILIAFQLALLALMFSLLNNLIEGSLNSLQKPLIPKLTQFVSSLIGLGTTLYILLEFRSILAIPAGLLIRSITSLIPNTIYLIVLFKKNKIQLILYDFHTLKDYLKLTPNLFLSKLGTSLAGNIEPTLIGIFISAEVTVYYSVTKKAGELVKMLFDRIAAILYPSLAHMHSEVKILDYRKFCIKLGKYIFPLALIAFSIYFILNKNFICLWVGCDNYLGDLMTFLIGLSLLLSLFSNMLSYLLSSTGDIKFSSNLIFIESILKLVMLLVLLNFIGIYGLPLAIIIISVFFSTIYIFRWDKHLKTNELEKKLLFQSIFKFVILFVSTSIFIFFFTKDLLLTSFVHFSFLGLILIIIYHTILLFSDKLLKQLLYNKTSFIKNYARSKIFKKD